MTVGVVRLVAVSALLVVAAAACAVAAVLLERRVLELSTESNGTLMRELDVLWNWYSILGQSAPWLFFAGLVSAVLALALAAVRSAGRGTRPELES